jgi:hypothetical protein
MEKIFLKILLAIDVLAIIAYQVCALFLVKYDTVLGITTDGFGRVLKKAPLIFRSQGLMEEWAGLGWFAVDMICSFVLFAVAYLLFTSITDRK